MADIETTLEMLGDYELSPLERILLSTDGTVQTLLSVIFATPVQVEVISQIDYGEVFVRWVKLVTNGTKPVTVALAESVIPFKRNDDDFIGMMGDRNIGIGEAIKKTKVYTQRLILGIHVDDTTFSRTYRIVGDSIDVIITETFNRGLFNGN